MAIGAQVGYNDLAGFGRRAIDIPAQDLIADVIYHIRALDGFARAAGSRVSYVKPRGALYNTTVTDVGQAAAVVEAVRLYDPGLPLLGLLGSQLLLIAQTAGLRIIHEAFADRAYTSSGQLVSRRLPGAVLHDPAQIAERCVQMAVDGFVIAEDGSRLDLTPDSICVHGDTPDAEAIARRIRRELLAAGVTLESFANPHDRSTRTPKDLY